MQCLEHPYLKDCHDPEDEVWSAPAMISYYMLTLLYTYCSLIVPVHLISAMKNMIRQNILACTEVRLLILLPSCHPFSPFSLSLKKKKKNQQNSFSKKCGRFILPNNNDNSNNSYYCNNNSFNNSNNSYINNSNNNFFNRDSRCSYNNTRRCLNSNDNNSNNCNTTTGLTPNWWRKAVMAFYNNSTSSLFPHLPPPILHTTTPHHTTPQHKLTFTQHRPMFQYPNVQDGGGVATVTLERDEGQPSYTDMVFSPVDSNSMFSGI